MWVYWFFRFLKWFVVIDMLVVWWFRVYGLFWEEIFWVLILRFFLVFVRSGLDVVFFFWINMRRVSGSEVGRTCFEFSTFTLFREGRR